MSWLVGRCSGLGVHGIVDQRLDQIPCLGVSNLPKGYLSPTCWLRLFLFETLVMAWLFLFISTMTTPVAK